MSPQFPARRSRRALRSAFTSVELLAVIAVIAILLSVILPAVQAVRETSRRTECRAHLHQFGVAIQAFEAVHHRLPSPSGPYRRRPPVPDMSTHFMLLPYLEANALYRMVEFDEQGAHIRAAYRVFLAAIERGVPVFLCPSDPTDHGNNIRLCTGSEGYACGLINPCPHRAAFGNVGGITYAQVYDGTANTVAASERFKSDDDFGAFNRLDYWYSWYAGSPGWVTTVDMVAIARRLVPPPRNYQVRVGHYWHEENGGTTVYNHLLPPNSPILDCAMDGSNEPITPPTSPGNYSGVGVFSARSFHSGGVNVLYLDGSVDVTADEIDLAVWQALSRIAEPRS